MLIVQECLVVARAMWRCANPETMTASRGERTTLSVRDPNPSMFLFSNFFLL